MMTENEDMVDVYRVITPLIKAFKESSIKMQWANEFKDYLEKPDSPYPEVLEGARLTAQIKINGKGKAIFLSTLPGLAKGKKGPEIAMLVELINLLAGADMSQVCTYHRESLVKLLKLNEMSEAAMTPSGAKSMLTSFIPFDMIAGAAQEIGPGLPCDVTDLLANTWKILECLEGIHSIGFQDVHLPEKYAANKQPASFGVKATFENFAPFALARYMLGDAYEQLKAAISANSNETPANSN